MYAKSISPEALRRLARPDGPNRAAGPVGAQGEPGVAGATGATGPTAPFLPSYIEALGDTQPVANAADVVFSVADYVGNNVEFSPPDTTFTIQRTGLYLVEWGINLAADNTVSAEVGLLQNGLLTSGAANSSMIGNFSSGALINVGTVPYVITLHNQSGEEIRIENDIRANGAASIRILRFADGPTA